MLQDRFQKVGLAGPYSDMVLMQDTDSSLDTGHEDIA
jgi:hypothetical protein